MATASLIALVSCLAPSPSASLAEVPYTPPTGGRFDIVTRVTEKEAMRFDDKLETAEMRNLLKVLERNGSGKDLKEARLKVGFRRDESGRVSIKSDEGQWFDVKPDSQAPGFLLLRDVETGRVSFLPADTSGRLMQIDLSDDMVVGQLFGSGAWEDVMEGLEAEEEGQEGRVIPFVMEEEEFRNTFSLLVDSTEEPMPEAA